MRLLSFSDGKCRKVTMVEDWNLKIGGTHNGYRTDAVRTDSGRWLPVVDLKVVFPLMGNVFDTWEEAISKAKDSVG